MRRIVTFTLLVFLLAACVEQEASQSASIEVYTAWARPAKAGENTTGHGSHGSDQPMGGSNSAAYMVIVNTTDIADRLVQVESDVAKAIEMHQTTIIDGIASMAPVKAIDVPANDQVELKPGGLHIMLIGLTRDLIAGETIQLTLVFEKAGRIAVTAEVHAP